MRHVIYLALFVSMASFGDNVTQTIEGPKQTYGCSDPKAIGPMTGLYRQTSGGYICVLDYETVVLIEPPPNMPWHRFSGEFQRTDPSLPQVVGDVYLSGITYHKVETPGGGSYIYTKVCPLQGSSRLMYVSEQFLVWNKPVFVYQAACCNLMHIRYTQDRLTRVASP